MTHTLISFLGKTRKENGGQYKTACYQFADGTQRTARFFGLALQAQIQAERVIILGTAGSMWDVLCEHLGADDVEKWTALSEAVENDSVSQAQLDDFALPVSQALGVDCQLRCIPYGDDLSQQVAILQIMAATVQAGDSVSLDLTHGLRHLPMLGLLSAMYLQTARNANINGIYYGALDRTKDNVTPVMQLAGLLQIADWIHALDGFNKTGDLSPFADLLQQDGMAQETAVCLRDAAFFEKTLNIPQAKTPLKKFAAATQNGLSGIGALFQDSLQQRIAWHKQDNFYLRQRENAYFYLRQGDYLRAAALGYEAYITWHVQNDKTLPRLDPQEFEHREIIKARLDKRTNKDYKILKNLRNALAHAGLRNAMTEVKNALKSKTALDAELNRIFSCLLPIV